MIDYSDTDIQGWAATTLKNSASFNQFCIDTIGKTLTFVTSEPVDDRELDAVALPFISIWSTVYEENNLSQTPYNKMWTMPISIGIEAVEKPVDINGILVFESTKIAKALAWEAKITLQQKANECGIDNKDIRLIEVLHLSVTEIGEADDIQANLILNFGQATTL